MVNSSDVKVVPEEVNSSLTWVFPGYMPCEVHSKKPVERSLFETIALLSEKSLPYSIESEPVFSSSTAVFQRMQHFWYKVHLDSWCGDVINSTHVFTIHFSFELQVSTQSAP